MLLGVRGEEHKQCWPVFFSNKVLSKNTIALTIRIYCRHHVGATIRQHYIPVLSWAAHFQIIYLMGLNTTENHRKHRTA